MIRCSTVGKQHLHPFLVGLRNEGSATETATLSRALLGQNVILAGTVAFELSGRSGAETLFGGPLGFHLRHTNPLS